MSSIVENYMKICKAFMQDTIDLDCVDIYKHYTTSTSGWEETSDNAHGGYDVSWAFHKTTEYIEQNAHYKLIEELNNTIEWLLDEGCDKEQVEKVVEQLYEI